MNDRHAVSKCVDGVVLSGEACLLQGPLCLLYPPVTALVVAQQHLQLQPTESRDKIRAPTPPRWTVVN